MFIRNFARHGGHEFVRSGKRWPYAIIMTIKDSSTGELGATVQWASTLERAERQYNADMSRWTRVRNGESLRGLYSTAFYQSVTDIVIVGTTTE